MIPAFDEATGNLPPGIHDASWEEIVDRFGHNATRRKQLQGLKRALDELASAGLAQKRRYQGELVIADALAEPFGSVFLESFQRDRDTGAAKGIVRIDLEEPR